VIDGVDTNLSAADLDLTPEQIEKLDTVSALHLGYPHTMRTDPGVANAVTGGKADSLVCPPLTIV